MDPKPKKKATDYAGIAALITAIAGVLALFWNQAHVEERAGLVQDSLLTVLQYRIEKLDKETTTLRDAVVDLRIEMAKRPVSRRHPRGPTEAPEPVIIQDAPVTLSVPVEGSRSLLGKVVDRVRDKKSVSGDQLRNMVQQTGKALEQSDLEE